MNQFNRDGSNASNAIVTASDAAVALSADRQENTPPYMKLIADCWEHILDYLWFDNMGSLGKTCKRLHHMVTYYLHENFPDTQFMLIGKEVHLAYYSLSFPVEFSRFVSTLCISDDEWLEWDYLLDAAVFHSLKTLMFRSIELEDGHIDFTYDVLQQIEKLDFSLCFFTHEIFEQMIDLCYQTLKTLNTVDCDRTDVVFSQYYPALEDFKCIPPRWSPQKLMPELKIFLEEHSQLKRFESDYLFLWNNRNTLNETDAQLDQLVVHFFDYDYAVFEMPFEQIHQFIDFLKKLHEREFYKTLHLVFKDETVDINLNFQELSRELSTLTSTLTGLSVLYPIDDSITDLSRLINLKEIHFQEVCRNNAELEIIAKGLVKLEKITINRVHVGQIEQFIRHSKKLKTLKIGDYLSDTVIDLFKLNNERKQLENANPIVIFASEHIYLPAKWNSKHLNLDLVQISRIGPVS